MNPIIKKRRRLTLDDWKAVLDEVGTIAFPGGFDTLSAKICERAGFPFTFVSGYSVAATAIGEPDLGLLTQTEMIEHARRICASVSIPVIVDEVIRQYQVQPFGATDEITERFYAISAERRIRHPAISVITEAARTGLFFEVKNEK